MKVSYALLLGATSLGGQMTPLAATGPSDTVDRNSQSHGMSLTKTHLHQRTRKIQESDAETCDAGLNGDPLFYLTAENGEKDYTSFFSCEDQSESGFETTTCDYAELLKMFRGPCEINGYQLYSVSLVRSCPGSSVSTIETELPVCLGTTCDVEQVLVPRLLSRFESCDNQKLSVSATPLDRMEVRGEACAKEMESFTQGIGDPGFVYSSQDYIEKLCSTSEDGGYLCDFSPEHAAFQSLCTEQGGILYQYSDTVVDTVTNVTDGNVQTFTNPSLGVPVCLGQSCNAETYFNELVQPHYLFTVNGTFTAATNGTTTSTKVYTFTGFERVSTVGTDNGDTDVVDDGQASPETEIGAVSSTSSNAANIVCSLPVYGALVVLLQVLVALN